MLGNTTVLLADLDRHALSRGFNHTGLREKLLAAHRGGVKTVLQSNMPISVTEGACAVVEGGKSVLAR